MNVFTPEIEEKLPDGFVNLVNGYGLYAAEVAVNRAFPAIDGFKPSQRRILYTMHKYKVKDLQKSANVCGKVMEFHPHSDASVYETMLPMVDSSEYTQFPFLHGKGNFSKVYFSDKDSQAAAPRYTEVCLSEKSGTLFGEMDGVEMQPTEDAHSMEPAYLPTSFPNILTTPTMGIAVGLACNIPSFNFNEVLNLTLEYLKTGKITQAIAPDFNCGGELVLNNPALKQIMLEGKGTLKLRGKWRVENKDIIITQLPYYAHISDILTVARTLPGVAVANDETDLNGARVRITCTSKNVVDAVVLQLLRDSKLQCSVSANIAVVIDNKPQFIGVIEVIEKWCDFRRKVLKKQYELDLAKVRASMRAPKALVELISNQPLKEKFLDAMKISHIEAERVLREAMPDVDNDVIDYILDLKIRQFADCEARKRQYQSLKDKENQIMIDLANIDNVIIRQLTYLNNTYKIPRKTSIVTNDYSFESIEEAKEAKEAVANYPVKVQVKGLFIKKMRFYVGSDPAISCMNKDVISILDSKGRLLRLPLSSVPDCATEATGAYIPNLLGIPRDFDIVDCDIIADGKKSKYFYRDGFVACLDLSEWFGVSRLTRITERGVAPDYADKLMMRLDYDGKYLLCVTKNKQLGIIDMEFTPRGRTARSKLVTVEKDDEIVALAPITYLEIVNLFPDSGSKFMGRCRDIRPDMKIDYKLLTKILSNHL